MIQPKNTFLLLISYLLFPIFSIELFSQFQYKVGFFKLTNISKPTIQQKAGLHRPFIERVDSYKTLYGDYKINKNIKFRTDKFGTIIPSSIPEDNNIEKSILFCGGSSIESSAVMEGNRVTDRFSYYYSIPAINASRSGKGLSGCIKTIDYLLSEVGKPKEIVISTNVNTLMDFGVMINEQNIKNLQKVYKFSIKSLIKNLIKNITPGIYRLRSEIKSNYFQEKEIRELPNYEKNLFFGCCHGAGAFNKEKNYSFDWLSKNNQERYANYIENLILDLKNKLKEKYYFSKVTIFIEPNSYLNKTTASLRDYRQFLYDFNGRKLDGINSANYTLIYDKIYKNTFKNHNFRVIEIPLSLLRSKYFYDAVHLTPSGADMIGKFFADNIIMNNKN